MQDQPDDEDQHTDSAATLSALEDALRHALASGPRDQVVKCIMSALPAETFVGDSTRLHGGKVRKVSVSMPEELTEAVRVRTGPGGFSRYVTEAVQEQIRQNLLDELAADLEERYGPVDEQGVREATREWPDFEEE
jgi:hypothetical protein